MDKYAFMVGEAFIQGRKKKDERGSSIDAILRKFNYITGGKNLGNSGGYERYSNDVVSDKGLALPGSEIPLLLASCCQIFNEQPHAYRLPLPQQQPSSAGGDDSGVTTLGLELHERCTPWPIPLCSNKSFPPDGGYLATGSVSSNRSMDTDDQPELQLLSPQASEDESGNITAVNSPSRIRPKDESSIVIPRKFKDQWKPVNLLSDSYVPLSSEKDGPLSTHMTKLQIPHHAGFCSAPDSSIPAPSRSSVRASSNHDIIRLGFASGRLHPDVSLVGSGKCFSAGSGQNSGDMSLSSPQSRCSPESSPIYNPRMTSRGSQRQICVVTPLHPWDGVLATDITVDSPDNRKAQCHRLPRPPVAVPSCHSFPSSCLTVISPVPSRNPGQAESLANSISCWKKGRLIGSGTYGRVYLGFNSESGEMCAMKEVTLLSDDAMSKESVQQLEQEINLLSCLRHPNIVRYFGSEMVDDKLYIYLEHIPGGSIHKLLQEYGQLGESAIRSYTQQILSGLAYLHAKSTVHRDIKGANILVDPTGRVKLADFGMAKHITGQPCPLSFKGSPYWMAPEVIRNCTGCNLAVDIWSLGCTVIEMAAAKPPWSQYEGVAALFKIGNSEELPTIPDHLSEEGKDFVRQCLRRNPLDRPTAVQLLQHPFVRNVAPLERSLRSCELPELLQPVSNAADYMDIGFKNRLSCLETKRVALQSRGFKIGSMSSDAWIPKRSSCPVSRIGSPLSHPNSSQTTLSGMKPPATFRPQTASASSTSYTGGIGTLPVHHSAHSKASYLYECSPVRRPKNSVHANRCSLCCKPSLESETSFGIREISQARRTTVSLRSSFRRKSACAACSLGSMREL